MRAKMARFYGWTDREISKLSLPKFMDYWIAITPLEANEAMLASKVSAYPHMEKMKRIKFFQELKRSAKIYIKRPRGKLKTVAIRAKDAARKMIDGK